MNVVREIVRGGIESIRETLPSTVAEGGAFLAGLSWAFVLHWTALIVTTLAYCAQKGGC